MTPQTTAAPPGSGLPQHLSALQRANRTRLARAELKRQIAAGERTVISVLEASDWEAETMAIGDLLVSQHRWGHHRVRKFLTRIPMLETKHLGTLTDRQRRELIDRLTDLTYDY